MTDETEVEDGELEEYDPRECMIHDGSFAVPDLDALESAVAEASGGQPLAWQANEGQLFVLIHRDGALKWLDVEAVSAKPARKLSTVQ